MRAVAEEQEALEEVRDKAIAAQEEASRLEQASRRRTAELLARERLVRAREEAFGQREKSVESARVDLAYRSDELERSHAEVHRQEEEVVIRETDVEIMVTAQDAREEQNTRREAEAASTSVTLTAREEQATKWEVELAARERALAALAEQLNRGQAKALATSGVPTSAATRGVVEAEEMAAREAVQDVAVEVAACFMREPPPELSSGSSSEASSLPSEPADLD
ncbi:vicilin-like seed storage protein At2g18540 [Phragmites australis]|uniref:vicilin-like seed storage protein At2g18540 n=1 Tax=Phragmites australis TaxID=29695 RepID=UPI002D77B242|nr:vicilin-like seed storage protein At2g18540 [Phragmites australis]